MIEKIKNILPNKILPIIKVILNIILIICIIMILKYFGVFKKDEIKPPIIPGNTTVTSQPSLDSGEILVDIDNMIKFLEKRKGEIIKK